MFSNTFNNFSNIFANNTSQEAPGMQHESQQDLIDNPSPRCPVALVLDTSGSMDGDPIEALNAGAQRSSRRGTRPGALVVDLAVYTAGSQAQCLQGFVGIEQIGSTPPCRPRADAAGTAVGMALTTWKRARKPTATTACPTTSPGWSSSATRTHRQLGTAAQRARQLAKTQAGELARRARRLTCHPGPVLNKPAGLAGLKFREFFQWLSASMARCRQHRQTHLWPCRA